MPSAANGEVDKLVPMYNAENSPIRRMVEILQGKIASLEKQRNKLTSGGKGGKDAAASGEPIRANSVKVDELTQMLEFVWDLCKQAMGIAILSENEAKKQARKESAMRKSQDTQLVRDVLLILDCLEQLNDPAARQDFLAGAGGAAKLTENDLRVLDDIYPEVTPKHCPEEGEPPFEEQTMNAAKHLIAIMDGNPGDIVGSTYAHIKDVVDTVHKCGYLDLSKDADAVATEIVGVEDPESAVREVEAVEETEYVAPPQASPPQPAPPPPAPQAVPTPTFPLLPPNAPPVTLQQVEHAYFAQQYGHQQKPPIPEVFSPLNFIFLQESEIDTPEPTPQPPSPRSVTPNSVPTQTFTNQNFSIPGQHFTGPEPHLPPLPPGAQHYTADMPPNHMAGYPGGNPPPPIPMPLNMPPYQQNMPYKVAQHPHQHAMDRVQPSSPTPPIPSEVPPHQDNRIPSPAQHNTQDADYSEWNPQTVDDNKNADKLEIDEWSSPTDHKHEQDSESGNHMDSQSGNRFRSRGRGGRGGPGGSYRGRGGFQNGGRSNGNYYRNNDSYQNRTNTNGDSSSYRDSNKYENSQGGYRGGRGNSENRGWRREGGSGGVNNKGGAPRRGGPPRERGDRQYQQRKGPNNANQYASDNKQYTQ